MGIHQLLARSKRNKSISRHLCAQITKKACCLSKLSALCSQCGNLRGCRPLLPRLPVCFSFSQESQTPRNPGYDVHAAQSQDDLIEYINQYIATARLEVKKTLQDPTILQIYKLKLLAHSTPKLVRSPRNPTITLPSYSAVVNPTFVAT